MRVEHALTGWAESLALRHFPKGRVDPEVIARAEGLEVVHAPFQEEVDGILVRGEGKDWIVVNTRRVAEGSGRSRFTVAHELGHWFERRRELAMRVPGLVRLGERPADRFAAHLLMPGVSFLSEFNLLRGSGLARISLLSSIFGTSLAATAYRAVELDCFRFPAAVLLWDQFGRRIGRRVSPDTLGFDPDHLDIAESPPLGYVTSGAINSLAIGLRTGRTPSMHWFISLWGDEEEHHLDLQEEVMSRGGHGWITLLARG